MSFKTAYTSLTLVWVLLGTSCRPKPQDQITEEDEFLKAGIALTREDPGAAIHCLTRVIQLNPKLAVAYQHRAIALTNVRNYEVAEADVKSAIALEGESSAILKARAEIERQTGRTDAAIATLAQIIEFDPRNASNFSQRAWLKDANGDLDGASDDYTRALDLETDKTNLHIFHERRASIRERLGDLDGAVADYTASIGYPSRNTFFRGDPNFRRGSILYRRGIFQDALRDFRAALARCRDRMNTPARVNIWLVRSRMGERKQADEELNAFLTNKESARFVGSNERKLIEFLLGKIGESEFLEHCEASSQEESEEDALRVARVWFYVGMKRLLDGDNLGAVKWLRKAAPIPPKEYPLEERQWAESELKLLNLKEIGR